MRINFAWKNGPIKVEKFFYGELAKLLHPNKRQKSMLQNTHHLQFRNNQQFK